MEKLDCHNIKNHTKSSPNGYLQWQDWAKQMSKNNGQYKCPDCGYFVMWRSKLKH